MQGTPTLDGTGDPGSTRLTIDHWDPEQMLEFPDTVDGLLAQVSDPALTSAKLKSSTAAIIRLTGSNCYSMKDS